MVAFIEACRDQFGVGPICRALKIVNQRLLAKPHFGLRRMDVDIHFLWRHLEKQQSHRGTSGRNNVAISLGDGVQQQAIADKPLVDKNID